MQYRNNQQNGIQNQSSPYDIVPPPQNGTSNIPSTPQSHATMISSIQSSNHFVHQEQQEQQHEQHSRQDPHEILNDCRAIGFAIDDLESRLTSLSRYQREFVLSGDRSTDIDHLSKDMIIGYRGLAGRVKRIKTLPESQEVRNRSQVDALDRRIRKAINSYQLSESEFRKDIQEQQRRQFLIVRPDATEEEIQEATGGDTGAQIFKQALMNSDRRGQAQDTLHDVRQRHSAIQQIEETMLELQQLFQDLDVIVMEQQPVVQKVEQEAVDTHEHLKQGNVQLDRAIMSARAARRKKWILLGVCVAIVLVILIITMIWAGVTGQFVSLVDEFEL
jgi:syntaxin 1B/2/3